MICQVVQVTPFKDRGTFLTVVSMESGNERSRWRHLINRRSDRLSS